MINETTDQKMNAHAFGIGAHLKIIVTIKRIVEADTTARSRHLTLYVDFSEVF